MDARKRWYADNNNDIYQIMQRFRPIVPKPSTGSPLNAPAVKSTTAGGGGRITNKRKYVKGGTKNKRNKSAQTDSLFTLQLLPPEEDSTPAPPGERVCCILNDNNNNILLPTSSSSSSTGGSGGGGGGMSNSSKNKKKMMMEAFSFWDPSSLLLLDRTVETWVTVERVTGNCMDDIGRGLVVVGGGGGWCCSTDEEMIMNLERDTSPGFISDGDNKVKWVNMAYRKMVWDEEEEEEPPQVVVNLVADDELASISLLGFSCRVRVQFELMENQQQQCRQIVVPCDVWRLKEFVGGGLAWRLDVQTALSLGPP